MKRFLLFLLCSVALAANIEITVLGTTQTQIMLRYQTATPDTCTLGATDNNGGPPVADLDATKFTNANQDLWRTVVNGFFWPTLVSIVLVGSLAAAGIHHFYALMSFGLCLFVTATVVMEFWKV